MNEINLPKGDLTEGDLTEAELKRVIAIWREKLRGFDANAYAYANAIAYTNAYAIAYAYANANAIDYAYDYAVAKINQFWLEAIEEIRNERT